MRKTPPNCWDKRYWRYDAYTGTKISRGKHAWYVVDSCLSRHTRKLIAIDVVLVTTLVAFVALFLIHPSLTFGIDRMKVESPEPPASSQTDYYKSQLTADEAAFYDEVYIALLGCRNGIDIPAGLSEEDAGKTVDAVLMDHPEIFWTVHWNYRGIGTYCVMFTYLVDDPSEIAEKSERYQHMAHEAIYGFDPDYDPDNSSRKAAMAAHLYEWVCQNADYIEDDGCGYDQTIMGVFEGDGCVCAGYSRTYKYLCDKAGIPCYYIVGRTTDIGRDSSHAWNVVAIDGTEPYYVDVTWGDKGDEADWHWYSRDNAMFDSKHIAVTLDVDNIA